MKPYLKIVLIYVFAGILWIYFSDELTELVTSSEESASTSIQTYKGVFFILLTGSLLYWLLHRYDKEQKGYVEDLKKKQAETNLLFESEEITMLKLTADGCVKRVSKKFLNLTGYEQEEVIGHHYREFLKSPEKEVVDNILATLQNRIQKSFNVELKVPTKAGKLVWFNFIGAGVYHRDKLGNLIILAQDVSRKKSEAMERAKMILSGQEKERERISMLLHDSLAQVLASLKMHVQALRRDKSDEGKAIENITNLIREGIRQTRDLSHELRPPGFNEGLLFTIKKYMESRREACPDIHFEFRAENHIEEEDMDVFDKLNLYRIIQEFVTNSIKHSECDKIMLSVGKSNDYIEIFINDNGTGFQPARNRTSGIGLINMRARTDFDNIKCDFATSPGKGTEVRLIKYSEGKFA